MPGLTRALPHTPHPGCSVHLEHKLRKVIRLAKALGVLLELEGSLIRVDGDESAVMATVFALKDDKCFEGRVDVRLGVLNRLRAERHRANKPLKKKQAC